MKKYLLSFFMLVVALHAGAQMQWEEYDRWEVYGSWDGTTATEFKGSGTQADPYLIESPANLAYLATAVTKEEGFEGKYFKQTANLDLGNFEWQPIGSTKYKSYPFKGHYDGDNHVILNLKITEDWYSVALFSKIEAGSLKNLGIVSGKIAVKKVSAASLCSSASKGAVIENCFNLIDISSEELSVSGITYGSASKESCVIRRCYNQGNLTGGSDVSGIVHGFRSITDCYNSGSLTITGTGYGKVCGIGNGGFAGATITNCYNACSMNATNGKAYNMTATSKNVTCTNCYFNKEKNSFEGTDSGNAGCTPLSDAEMKSGKAWSGFDTEIWSFKAGAYPTLKQQGTTANEVVEVAPAYEIQVAGNVITIKGELAGSLIHLISLTGRMAAQLTATSNEVQLTAPVAGCYVVSVNGIGSQKVIVR